MLNYNNSTKKLNSPTNHNNNNNNFIKTINSKMLP